MGLRTIQLERKPPCFKAKNKAGERKWLRNQRDRLIRRTPVSEHPFLKNRGWEY